MVVDFQGLYMYYKYAYTRTLQRSVGSRFDSECLTFFFSGNVGYPHAPRPGRVILELLHQKKVPGDNLSHPKPIAWFPNVGIEMNSFYSAAPADWDYRLPQPFQI